MSSLFPRHTVEWKLEEPAAFRRLTLSLVEMAILTGLVVRLLRAIILTGVGPNWWWVGGTWALLAVILCLSAAAHLSNYPVRQWFWRVPAFVGVEVLTEMLVSLALMALGREAIGTSRAHYHDWPQLAMSTLKWRLTIVIGFAFVLAAVVQTVRYFLLRHEHRAGTIAAVHEEAERIEAEHAHGR
jgi:hypothetical protein